jgi:quercetin dioxygenase-like cupin family protein
MNDDVMHSRASHDGSSTVPVELTDDFVGIGGFGTRFLCEGTVVRDSYALIEHTLAPGLLGAPPHRHANEDEVSYVLEGGLTVWRAGAVTIARPGAVVTKPRGEWHTFWNAGPEPVRFLEIISPPRFAAYFRELGTLIQETGRPDPQRIDVLAARYGLEFDFATMGKLLAEYRLRLG